MQPMSKGEVLADLPSRDGIIEWSFRDLDPLYAQTLNIFEEGIGQAAVDSSSDQSQWLWWIIVVVVSDNEEEKSEMIFTVIMYMYNVSNVFISSVTIYVCGGGEVWGPSV